MKNLLYSALIFIILSATNHSQAETVTRNVDHAVATTGYHWQLSSGYDTALSVMETNTGIVRGRYDLSECIFCEGEDDGCERDGIFSITLKSSPKSPTLAAICHVGAHSQKIQIFEPLKNAVSPVHTTVGAFYVEYETTDNGILIRYDRSNADGEFSEKNLTWP
ncbi:MAG: hypothetical protein V7761_10735 [Amylibacter sp.]